MNTATIYQNAARLSSDVLAFWASSVGRPFNSNLEFCILAEWHDAIEAAQAEALMLRDWISVDEYDAMLDECNQWLDHWQSSRAI